MGDEGEVFMAMRFVIGQAVKRVPSSVVDAGGARVMRMLFEPGLLANV
jgi:hypothetical protein